MFTGLEKGGGGKSSMFLLFHSSLALAGSGLGCSWAIGL